MEDAQRRRAARPAGLALGPPAQPRPTRIHDAVDHRRLHRDLTARPGREGQGFLDAPPDLASTGRQTASATGSSAASASYSPEHIAPGTRTGCQPPGLGHPRRQPDLVTAADLSWSLVVAGIPPRTSTVLWLTSSSTSTILPRSPSWDHGGDAFPVQVGVLHIPGGKGLGHLHTPLGHADRDFDIDRGVVILHHPNPQELRLLLRLPILLLPLVSLASASPHLSRSPSWSPPLSRLPFAPAMRVRGNQIGVLLEDCRPCKQGVERCHQ